MTALKVRKVGNSLGVVLPKDVLSRMKVVEGDKLFFSESPDGYRVTRGDPQFEEQMRVARAVMKRRRAALRELAK
jgi:putative addiction module antidote